MGWGGEAANFPGDPSSIPVSSSQTQKRKSGKDGRKTPCFRKNRGAGRWAARGSRAQSEAPREAAVDSRNTLGLPTPKIRCPSGRGGWGGLSARAWVNEAARVGAGKQRALRAAQGRRARLGCQTWLKAAAAATAAAGKC